MDANQSTNDSQKKSVGPSTVLDYLNPRYWDDRFTNEEHYEWLKDYSHFRDLIQAHLNPKSSVLELGCGNSQLSLELHRDGFNNITCSDLSSIAVENMKKRLEIKGIKEIKVVEADMLDLPFNDESFDVVIDKGTIDVLFVDSGDPWNPKAETVIKVMKTLKGVHRVLKKDGIFISISFGQPHFRRPLYGAEEFTWSVEWKTFGDGFHYFFYILKKGTKSLDGKGSNEKLAVPSLCLLQDELEGEDFIFRADVDELNS